MRCLCVMLVLITTLASAQGIRPTRKEPKPSPPPLEQLVAAVHVGGCTALAHLPTDGSACTALRVAILRQYRLEAVSDCRNRLKDAAAAGRKARTVEGCGNVVDRRAADCF